MLRLKWHGSYFFEHYHGNRGVIAFYKYSDKVYPMVRTSDRDKAEG